MLIRQINQLKHCANIDEIIVATTGNPSDEPIVNLMRENRVRWFCGSEHDVLKRYVDAASDVDADVIIRVTADCPLIDPSIADRVIAALVSNASDCDYASNVLQRTYPRGLDVEVMFMDTLLRIDRMAYSQAAREHVTIVPRSERPDMFMLKSVVDATDNSDLRWTVDTEADLLLVRKIYEHFNMADRQVLYPEILSYVRSKPELGQINEGVETWSPD